MNDEELFKAAMSDVKPLAANKDHIRPTKLTVDEQSLQTRRYAAEAYGIFDKNRLSIEHIPPVKPDDVLEYKKDGVQHGVYKNLRTGKYEIQSVLNLKGSSLAESREKLFNYMEKCHKENIRTILIQHGKGKDGNAPLKSALNSWLPQFSYVMAFHSAERSHGGLASTYVLLKKSEEAKLTNREIHQKRGS